MSVSACSSTSTTAAATSATAREKTQLAALLRSYQAALNSGQSADSLKPQAGQITATAKLLGQSVVLPTAAAAPVSPAPVSPAPISGAPVSPAPISGAPISGAPVTADRSRVDVLS